MEDVINFIFIVDVAVCFLSAFYDEDNVLIKDRKTIALVYLKSWFLIDLVACIPFDRFFGGIDSYRQSDECICFI